MLCLVGFCIMVQQIYATYFLFQGVRRPDDESDRVVHRFISTLHLSYFQPFRITEDFHNKLFSFHTYSNTGLRLKVDIKLPR